MASQAQVKHKLNKSQANAAIKPALSRSTDRSSELNETGEAKRPPLPLCAGVVHARAFSRKHRLPLVEALSPVSSLLIGAEMAVER